MHINYTKKLDAFKVALSGINLIEASAGTGKTFTIILLYLRCLLGIGEKKYKKKLLIHEILVLTFTNTAKEELYIRIKESIYNLYIACINKTSTDPVCKLFLKEIQDIDEAIYILKKAHMNINNAAIYTIHSFCQNILTSDTFYISNVFEDKIIENENDLYLKSTQDFWRLYLYTLPENIIKIILQYYSDPKHLLKIIKPFLYINKINFKNKILDNNNVILIHKENIKKINIFKKQWLFNSNIILNEIHRFQINKKIYNKYNLSRWINDITIWAKSKTEDYQIPISLKYFTEKNIKKYTINYIQSKCCIFKKTEKILQYNFSLNHVIILYAIKKIKKLLIQEKKKQALLGFNDLLSNLMKILKKEKYLKELIQKKYPITFIDEFQDTDIEQYQIFNLLYKKNKELALFLIGDPKQAIYSFRGADIFSYFYITSKIKKKYYLDTNWRSSKNLCDSINILFSQNKNPFIFEKISFQSIISADKNSKIQFIINGISQIPIKFFLYKKKEVYLDEYQIWIAHQCAKEISYWLTYAHKGQAKIITETKEKILKANDIAILVRNKNEANIIKKALSEYNIISVYSSEKNSVFKILDAQELLWILESILEPDNQKLLQQAISTHILQKIYSKIETKKNNKKLHFLMEKLYEYHDIWKNVGIFQMIKIMILEYQKSSHLIEMNLHYIKNLNFLHIAEILEEKFQDFNKETYLIRWFQEKILEKKEPMSHEYIRNFSESSAVQIITIHKSKGLEYPIVWIPFMINFHQSMLSIYHDKKTCQIIIDNKKNDHSFQIADKERLAEDIRLLYVAITRAIVHCCIGLSCLIKKKIKNRIYSDIHKSSIGYLIQDGKPMNYEHFLIKLNQLNINHSFQIKNNKKNLILSHNKKILYLIYSSKCCQYNNKNIWNITSFTKLKKEHNYLQNKKTIISLNTFNIKKTIKKNKKLTINNFPKGKNTGLMMHYILKNLHILSQKEENWFAHVLEKYNFSLKWTKILAFWIKNIINTPLDNKNMCLSKIEKKLSIQELEFFFPIKKTLYSKKLNHIIQLFDSTSLTSQKLLFNPIKGILKGYIDLFFIWKKKYYIIDYKSNWLGNNNSFYSQKNIQQEMIKQRYDLQYQIYTIAMHKYLKQKIKNYHYQNDFGGIFYFFLRAIEDKHNYNGIFYKKPDYSLIKKTISLLL